MAASWNIYNHTRRLLLAQAINLNTLKVMLLDANATFDATDTTLVDVLAGAATEVSGNGWDVGGEVLTTSVSTVDTSAAIIDAVDLAITASGGPIGPGYAYVIYDDTHADDAPLFYVDFDAGISAGESTQFKVTFPSSGLFKVRAPA